MSEVLVVNQPELLVTETVVRESVVVVERELLVQTVQEVLETTLTEVVIETNTVSEVLDQSKPAEIIEVARQGPPGPAGNAAVAGTLDLIYTGEVLTRINLADGTHKLFTYLGGLYGNLITRIDHVKTGLIVRKDFVYTGSRLEAVETSFV